MHRTFLIKWLLVLTTASLISFVDIKTTNGIAAGAPYLSLLFFVWWLKQPRSIIVIAIIAIVFAVFGAFFSNPTTTLLMAGSERGYTILAILACSLGQLIFLSTRLKKHRIEIQRKDVLKASYQIQRSFLKHTPLAIIIWNTKWDVISWNPSAERIFGYSREEAIATTIVDKLVPKEVMPDIIQVRDKLSIGSGTSHNTNYNVTKDGKRILCSWYNTALLNKDGEFIGVSSTVEDITEREEIRQKEDLRTSVLSQLAKGDRLHDILTELIFKIEKHYSGLMCSILLLNDRTNQLHTEAAPSLPDFYIDAINGIEIGEAVGSCSTAAFTGKQVIAEDIQIHPYWINFKDLAARANLRSCWSEPIKDSTNRILGTFALYRSTVSKPSLNETKFLTDIASLVSLAIEKKRAEDAAEQASLVYKISSEGIVFLDADNLIMSTNPAYEKMSGYKSSELIGKTPSFLSAGLHSNEFLQNMWQQINNIGTWQGEISNIRKDQSVGLEYLKIHTINNADGSPFRRIAIYVDIVEKKKAEELIWTQANIDRLTQLPNRYYFHSLLEQEIQTAVKSNSRLAVFYLGLDRFKEVNDQVGHSMANDILKDTAKRFIKCAKGAVIISHIGSDEFAFVYSIPKAATFVNDTAKGLLDCLNNPFHLKNHILHVSASIGIGVFPDDGDTIDILLTHTDQAKHAAKTTGNNSIAVYHHQLHDRAQERIALIDDLRTAVQEEHFTLYYQPIINLNDAKLLKAEALIRWEHAQHGFISPDKFIPLAEETGMIVDIGNFVMHEASSQAVEWREQYGIPMQISVNVSPRQFQGKTKLSQYWLEDLKSRHIPLDTLVIEITEGMVMEHEERSLEQLKAFRQAGIGISMDDFGTGYSSLSYLKKFNLDYLKIDRTFVSNLEKDSDDFVLCEAIIVMAHKLGLKVIAEGIETVQQRDLLRTAGCDFGQGYLFSKPVPASEFRELISKNLLSI